MGDAGKFRFGNGTCSAIEVDRFSPICDFPDIPGSQPLTLEVPVPTFAPFIPPSECACFAFDAAQGPVHVTMRQRSTITPENPLVNTARVEVKSKGDCCDGLYEITPWIDIQIPECLSEDHTISENTVDLGEHGSLTYKLKLVDCVPRLEITANPVSFNPPIIVTPPFCLNNPSITVTPIYYTIGADADHHVQHTGTPSTATGTVTTDAAGCKTIAFSGSAGFTVDVTSFNNQGSVFRDSDTNSLYTDGSYDVNVPTWYGGGLGDVAADNHENTVGRRGPAMRGGASACCQNAANCTVDYLVPHVTHADGNNKSEFKITTANGTKKAVVWNSRRISNDETRVGVFTDTTIATGNLSMVLPAGFQWNKRGVALNLCNFGWNASGLLSVMEETGVAALVSPGPCAFVDGAYIANTNPRRQVGGLDASGLNLTYPADPFTGGLSVADGCGLRIFGTDTKTKTSESQSAADARFGQLEVFAHDGDFKFNYDGKLVIDDSAVTGVVNGNVTTINPVLPLALPAETPAESKFNRTTDTVLRIGLTTGGASLGWNEPATSAWLAKCVLDDGNVGDAADRLDSIVSGTTTGEPAALVKNVAALTSVIATAVCEIIAWCNTWRFAYMHVGKAGTILKIDDTATAPADSERHYQASAPTSP